MNAETIEKAKKMKLKDNKGKIKIKDRNKVNDSRCHREKYVTEGNM